VLTGVSQPALPVRVARNFFVHSGHIPLVLLILEALLARPGYFFRIDPYLLLLAGIAQAWAMELLITRGRPYAFMANLVGPLLYSTMEVVIEGPAFFAQWHHQSYWGFSLGFAALHWLQSRCAKVNLPLVLLENILRSAIPLVIYALFEAVSGNISLSWEMFFADRAHDFLAVVLLLLGVLLGFADATLRRTMATVQELTNRLHRYSQWSLGSGILNKAMMDESSLALKRIERAVLFMDIRGFTAWSETHTPEDTVDMLNAYYGVAEGALGSSAPIKLKYTADEVMAVFASAPHAIEAGRAMLEATSALLNRHQLTVGGGVHWGQVIEGVLGAQDAKAYDFIGDTVNTAQRLCDAAAAGELLVSVLACEEAGMATGETRYIHAKGKKDPMPATVM
jgi:adenylate cyclase